MLNDRSRLAGEGKRGLFKGTDDRFSSCLGGGKLHAGLDLGQHASGGKLPLLSICLGLPAAHLLDLFLIGLIEVDAHSVNSGENVEILCVNDLRKALGGIILVDHGENAHIAALALLHNGDTAAAAGDHEKTHIDQMQNACLTLCNKIDDRFGGVADLRFLFFRRIAESIPAQCYYDSRYGAQ